MRRENDICRDCPFVSQHLDDAERAARIKRKFRRIDMLACFLGAFELVVFIVVYWMFRI